MSYSDADIDRYLQGGLPFRPIGVMLSNIPEEPPSIVEGLVVKGLIATLAGVPKIGKTTFTFSMLKAIGTGMPFLGRKTTRARTLLLTEEHETTLGEKFRIFGLDGNELHALMRFEALNDWPATVEQAIQYCLGQGLELLVVDPWDKWASFGFKEENDAGATIARIQPLYEATHAGLAVLILSHQSKAGSVRGSNAFTGAVDVVLELERAAGDTRVLKGASRLRSTPERIFLDWDPWTGVYSEQLPAANPWDGY